MSKEQFYTVESLIKTLETLPPTAKIAVHCDLEEAQGMLQQINIYRCGTDELPYDKGDDILYEHPELNGEEVVFLTTF